MFLVLIVAFLNGWLALKLVYQSWFFVASNRSLLGQNKQGKKIWSTSPNHWISWKVRLEALKYSLKLYYSAEKPLKLPLDTRCYVSTTVDGADFTSSWSPVLQPLLLLTLPERKGNFPLLSFCVTSSDWQSLTYVLIASCKGGWKSTEYSQHF